MNRQLVLHSPQRRRHTHETADGSSPKSSAISVTEASSVLSHRHLTLQNTKLTTKRHREEIKRVPRPPREPNTEHSPLMSVEAPENRPGAFWFLSWRFQRRETSWKVFCDLARGVEPPQFHVVPHLSNSVVDNSSSVDWVGEEGMNVLDRLKHRDEYRQLRTVQLIQLSSSGLSSKLYPKDQRPFQQAKQPSFRV